MKEVKKKYRKYVRECNVELKYKDGREEYLVMDRNDYWMYHIFGLYCVLWGI